MWINVLDPMLDRLIRIGRLDLTCPDGQRRSYGSGPEAPVAVTLHHPALLRKLVLRPELALGEAYVEGSLTIAGDDLRGLMTLLLRNRAAGHSMWALDLGRTLRRLWRRAEQYNPAARAQANVAHHYDLSGDLYDLFLDTDRQYSCAYFRSPNDSLERAQAQKKAHIAAKLLLKPGMRVLDIGCGWGGMALTLAREHGAQVVGVTLSREQHAVATARAAAAGLSDRVEFRLCDYREVDESFDRIVSVGMFEHVGVPHYRAYFAKVRALLAPDGVALIHTIGRITPPGSTSGWIAKYIFPGGYVPAMSEAMAAVERESLWPCDVEVWRLHYAETLRHWHDRFVANEARAQALYDERFCRMWRYYLVVSELSFRLFNQVVFQFQLARDQRAVPLTRDYLYPAQAAMTGQRHAAE